MVSYSLIQEEKVERSISFQGAKKAEIIDFSFWGGVLKKFRFKAKIIMEIVMFMFDFLNLPVSIFLSDRNLYEIQNVSKQYGI